LNVVSNIIFPTNGNRIGVKFPYDEKVISKLKTIPQHQWHPDKKIWSFPSKQEVYVQLLKTFEGKKVQIDTTLTEKFRKNTKATTENKLNSVPTNDDEIIQQVRKELRLRNYSHKTIKAYTSCLRSFIKYFAPRDPKEITEKDIREYLLHLIEDKKLSAQTINQVFNALRFLYVEILKMPFKIGSIPRPKKAKQLPVVLDKGEVLKIFDAVDNLKHKTILMSNSLRTNDYSISECHKFEYGGKVFVLNVETMQAFRINKALSDELDKLKRTGDSSDEQLPADLQEALNKLGLLQRHQRVEESPEALPAREPIKHISLNVAQTCNLSCVYCYGVDGEYSQKGLMKPETAFKAVDWLIEQSQDVKDLVVTFFGGEPLMNFRLIKQVVRYAKEKAHECEKNVYFSITTNGTLLTKEAIDYFNEKRFSVVISFDGDLEMQNKNRPFKRNNGSNEITRRGVREFLETRGGNVTARATITTYNTDLKKVRHSLAEMGFNRVILSEATLPVTSAAENGDNDVLCPYMINAHQRKAMLDDLEDQAKETLQAIKERGRPLTGTILGILQILRSKRKRKYFCGVGRGLVGISISGDVYPCHRFVGQEDLKMGCVDRFDPESQTAYIKNYGVSQVKCSKCWARYFCGGGCLHEALSANGNMTEPNKHSCNQLQRSVELGIAVYDQLDRSDREYLSLMKQPVDRTP